MGQTPKYVFYFMGDGMGINHVLTTQLYNKAMGLPELNFYGFPVRTYMTNSPTDALVTDSAAAGTALSTGVKTYNHAIGVDPEHNRLKNIAEYAHDAGKGVGVVTSVGLNHASPAAFLGHANERDEYHILSAQIIDECKADFIAGATFLTSKKDPENRKYSYWMERAAQSGIIVMKGREDYVATKGQRIIMTSNTPEVSSLAYAIDRKPGQTSLADFTECAIDHLYSNYGKKGFFLFVEGGKIDYGAHARDAATTVTEINDMAVSIELALDFYRQHPNETLIIVTADHETGGFSMTNGKYKLSPEVLAGQKCSVDALTSAIKQLRAQSEIVSWSAIKSLLTEKLGLWDSVPVSAEENLYLTQIYKESFLDLDGRSDQNLYSSTEVIAQEAIRYFDSVAQLTWASRSHSAAPVPLFVIGAKAEAFLSCKDNTDVPKTIKKVARY